MSDRVAIPRSAGFSDFSVMPAWWPSQRADGTTTIYVRCACGEHVGDLANHEIAGDGNVSPSILLTGGEDDCGWHVFARLLGWPP